RGGWKREDGRIPGLHLRHRERQIGACRHGDRCSRLHNRPTFSQTIVLLNLYRNPQNTAQSADGSHCHVSDVEVQEHYDNFFEVSH
uniref:C3H1-type domain-containing protein n=1 Tax=Terrapene triunguis TaxID=2587831 RepID=A0A674J743_9SAUR